MIERIKELHSLMTKHVLRAGVGEVGWVKLGNPDKWNDRKKVFVLAFLEEMYRAEWKAVNDLWTMFCATDEMWDSMSSIFADEDFPEMVKLKVLLKNLKNRWVRFKDEYKESRQ